MPSCTAAIWPAWHKHPRHAASSRVRPLNLPVQGPRLCRAGLQSSFSMPRDGPEGDDASNHTSLGRSTSTASTRTSGETPRGRLLQDPTAQGGAGRWARPARQQLESPFKTADLDSDLSDPSHHGKVRPQAGSGAGPAAAQPPRAGVAVACSQAAAWRGLGCPCKPDLALHGSLAAGCIHLLKTMQPSQQARP